LRCCGTRRQRFHQDFVRTFRIKPGIVNPKGILISPKRRILLSTGVGLAKSSSSTRYPVGATRRQNFKMFCPLEQRKCFIITKGHYESWKVVNEWRRIRGRLGQCRRGETTARQVFWRERRGAPDELPLVLPESEASE